MFVNSIGVIICFEVVCVVVVWFVVILHSFPQKEITINDWDIKFKSILDLFFIKLFWGSWRYISSFLYQKRGWNWRLLLTIILAQPIKLVYTLETEPATSFCKICKSLFCSVYFQHSRFPVASRKITSVQSSFVNWTNFYECSLSYLVHLNKCLRPEIRFCECMTRIRQPKKMGAK